MKKSSVHKKYFCRPCEKSISRKIIFKLEQLCEKESFYREMHLLDVKKRYDEMYGMLYNFSFYIMRVFLARMIVTVERT